MWGPQAQRRPLSSSDYGSHFGRHLPQHSVRGWPAHSSLGANPHKRGTPGPSIFAAGPAIPGLGMRYPQGLADSRNGFGMTYPPRSNATTQQRRMLFNPMAQPGRASTAANFGFPSSSGPLAGGEVLVNPLPTPPQTGMLRTLAGTATPAPPRTPGPPVGMVAAGRSLQGSYPGKSANQDSFVMKDLRGQHCHSNKMSPCPSKSRQTVCAPHRPLHAKISRAA